VYRRESWWYAGRPARFAGDPNMRVSDAERNEVADTLSKHYADGRLDPTEFKERLDRAMAAKTRGDLAGLTTDLPPVAPSAPVPAPRRRVPWVLIALVAVIALWSVPVAGGWLWVPHLSWILVALVVYAVVRHRHRTRSYAAPVDGPSR